MNAFATTPEIRSAGHATGAAANGVLAFAGWALAAVAVTTAFWLTRHGPKWGTTLAIALALFFALKIATVRGHACRATLPWTLAYLLLWPGMNAGRFFDSRGSCAAKPALGEAVAALGKTVVGIAMVAWAAVAVKHDALLSVAAVGMLGFIFVFHFGLFHVLSWLWRRAGIDAPLIMRAPLLATSLTEFWSERWNLAFVDSARRFLLWPLGRRWGAARAGMGVFLVSGVVHEVAISLPARGGWGGPMLYFLLNGLGAWLEKTVFARRCGIGRGGVRGWLWTLLFTAAPLPLLFHRPLLEGVILPLLRDLNSVLP
jgi:hypothetical protein